MSPFKVDGLSMDGRGRWLDKVFVERLWRSLKYEEVHLKAYADGREARAGIGAWIEFYNQRGRTRRSATARRCKFDATGTGQWTSRCAWTTQVRCPHTHSPHRSNRQHDRIRMGEDAAP
jgi:hypothetical protein